MDEVIVSKRKCSRCGEEKPENSSNFARDRGGFTRNCRACKGGRPTLLDRFWSKVRKGIGDECWDWIAGVGGPGYGELNLGRRGLGMVTAHRFSYELHKGAIPEGLCVMHSCDNRRCVNPSHLSLGTLNDNNQDAIAKGRFRFPEPRHGERSPVSKLTDEIVRAIRLRRANGERLTVMAKDYGVTEALVSMVALRKIWKRVA